MVDLLIETIGVLRKNGKGLSDIRFITDGVNCKRVNKASLSHILKKRYDNGFGLAEVNTKLKLVGDDFWLERYVYDGAESWEFKQMPKFSNPSKKILVLYTDAEN